MKILTVVEPRKTPRNNSQVPKGKSANPASQDWDFSGHAHLISHALEYERQMLAKRN